MSFTGGATLAAARVVLGVDSAQFSEGLRAAETQYAAAVGAMGGTSAELAERELRAAAATESLSRTLKTNAATSEQAMAATAGLVREQRRLVDVQAANRAEQTRFGSLTNSNTLRQRQFGSALGFTTNAFLGAAGLVYGIKSAVDASQRFQGEMRLLQTQALTTRGEVNYMTKAILAIAPAVAQGPDALSKGIYRVESAGFRGARALNVLKTAALGARIGHADLEQTTLALVAAQKSGIDSSKSLSEKMGTLDAIVGAGSLRMEDLTAALASGVVPAAKQFGLTLADLGGALDVLTVQGVPAELAATRLRYTIALLGAQTPKATKELQGIGLASTQLGHIMRTQGLLPALDLLETKLKTSGLSIEAQNQLLVRAFGGGRSSTTILTLIQNLDMLREKTQLIEKMGTSKSFQERVAAQKTTAEFAFAQLKAIAQVTEIRLGTALLPGVVKATTDVSHYLDKASTQRRLQRDVTQGFKDASEAAHIFGDAIHQVAEVFHVLDSVLPGNLLKQLLEGFLLFKAARIAKGFNTAFLDPMRAFTGATKDAQAQLGILQSQLVKLPAEEQAIVGLQLAGAPRLYGQQRYTEPGSVVSGGAPAAAEIQAAAASVYPTKPWMRAPLIAQLERQMAAEEEAAQAADLEATATEGSAEAMQAEAKAATEDAAALTSLADARDRSTVSAGLAAGAVQRSLAGAIAPTAAPAAGSAIPFAVAPTASGPVEEIARRYGLPTSEVEALQQHLAGLSPTARLELGSGLSSLTNTPPVAGDVGAVAQERDLLEGRLASLKAEQAYLADKYAGARTDASRTRWAGEQASNTAEIAAARSRMGEIAPALRQAALAGALGTGPKSVPGGAGFAAGPNRLAGSARARVAWIGRGKTSEQPFKGGLPHIQRDGQWWRISEEEAATLTLPSAASPRYPSASVSPRDLYTPGPFYAGGRSEAQAATDAAAQGTRGLRTVTYQSGGRTITRTLSPQEVEQAQADADRLSKEATEARKAADKEAGKAERDRLRRTTRQAALNEERDARQQTADDQYAKLNQTTTTRQALEAQLAALPKNTTTRGEVAGAAPVSVADEISQLQAQRTQAVRLLRNPALDPKFAREQEALQQQIAAKDAQLQNVANLHPALDEEQQAQQRGVYEKEKAELERELKGKADVIKEGAKQERAAIDSTLKDRQRLLSQYGPNATVSSPQAATNLNAQRKQLREQIAGAKEQEAADTRAAKAAQRSADAASQTSRQYGAASRERAAASKQVVSGLEQEAIKTGQAAAASQALVDQDAAASRADFERASAMSRQQAALEKLTTAQGVASDTLAKYQGLETRLAANQADEAAMLGDLSVQADKLAASYAELTVKQQLAREGLTAIDSGVRVLTGDEERLTQAVNQNSATIGAAYENRLIGTPAGAFSGGRTRGLFGSRYRAARRDDNGNIVRAGSSLERAQANPALEQLRLFERQATVEANAMLANIRGGLTAFGTNLRTRIGAAGGQGAFGAGLLLTLFGPQIASKLGVGGAGSILSGAGSGLIFGNMLGVNPYLAAGVGASFGLKSAIGGSPGSTRSKAGGIIGNVAEAAGVGAVLGSVIGPEGTVIGGLGAGAVGGIAAGSAALAGSLIGLFHSSDTTSKALLGLASAARQAHASVGLAKQAVASTQVSLANDRVNRDNARDSLKAARAAYEHAKGTKHEKEALDQLRAAEQNYHAAKRQVAQDERDLAKAHDGVSKAEETERKKTQQLAAGVTQIASGFRNTIVGGRGMALAMGTTAGKTQEASLRVDAFAGRLDDLAKKAKDTNPKLARTYVHLADIIRGMKNLPSAKRIDVIFKALYSGNWRVIEGVLGNTLVTNPAFSAADRAAAAHGRHHQSTGAGDHQGVDTQKPTKRKPRPKYEDPAQSSYLAHRDAVIAEIQAGLRKGNIKKLQDEELAWLRGDYARARTDGERKAIAEAISQIKSAQAAAIKSGISNNGIGLIPQPLQDRYNKAFQSGNKGAELKALEAERRYLERLAARTHGAEHHKAEQLLNVIVGKIDRLTGVTASSLVPIKDQLAVQKAIAAMYRSKHGNVDALERKRDLLLEYLKEPGHTRKQRSAAEDQLKQVQREIRQAKASGGGVVAVIQALQKEARDLDRIAHDRHRPLKTREQALAEENKVQAQIRAYEKKAYGVAGADFLTSPAQMKQWLKLQNQFFKAKQTPGTADDIRALKAEQSFLQRVRDRLHGKAQEEANKLLASIDDRLAKLVQISAETQKALMQTYLSEQASFFASFGSNVFTTDPNGQRSPGSQRPAIGELHQHFPPGTEDTHQRHAIYARHALQSQFD